MTLRIATWNVNSIRQRIDHLRRFCGDTAPDVLCLQETKCRDEDFPGEAVRALGYRHVLAHGEKGYNGVAILSRHPFEAAGRFDWCRRDDRRHAFVRLANGLELHSVYVPKGGHVPDPKQNRKFAYKLRFLREMARWCRGEQLRDRKLVLLGDLNVAPLECDVWNHRRLLRNVGHTPVETKHLASLQRAGGFLDAARHFVPPPQPLFTWWGYRFPQSVARDYGWRLDHVWVTPALAPHLAAVRHVKEARLWERPSDHVPVILDLD